MTKIQSVCLALGASALAVCAGCSSKDEASENQYPQPAASQGDEATPAEPTTSGAMGASATTPTRDVNAATAPAAYTNVGSESLRDSQILQVLKSVDQAEIDQANVARNKANAPRVNTFAEHMIEQHTRSQKEGADLASKMGVQPEDSKLGAELQGKAAQTLQTLRGTDASTFDRTYMQAQAKQHQEVLDLLDRHLMPSASNADMRATLKDVRAMVSSHLSEAQSILANLK